MSIWSQAREIAAATPNTRNRYADFLRAVSILFVIVGHWLITTAVYEPQTNTLQPVLALDALPWTEWLTWAFQVMPIFFIVGGYSNAISLESARRKNASYAEWLTGRLHRLLSPLLVLVVFWGGVAVALNWFGVSREKIVFLSRTALLPTWFLAIYTMIVLLAPLTYRFWRSWGFASLAVYVLLAVLVDAAFFVLDIRGLGWSNYFWVWLAVHHLGFAWHDRRLGTPAVMLLVSLVSFSVLLVLIMHGPYPVAMAGSPGEDVSNTLPPKITLIALGLFQFGLLQAIEKPMQRLLNGLGFWAATVLINTMIMTIYLWHMTVLLFAFVLSYFAGGVGLMTEPGTAEWWAMRPVWLLVLSVLLIPVALLLSPLERRALPKGASIPAPARLIAGAVMTGAGITMATLMGFDGNLLSLSSTGALVLVLGGGAICGLSIRR